MIGDPIAEDLLLAMLEGAGFANALRRNGKPCRIRLPDDPESRLRLVLDHLNGTPATLTFHAEGHEPWQEQVEVVVLAAFCPGVDGRCRWIGIDLDAADGHGEGGLVDPVHAARCIAERADNAGLLGGLIVARSRGGLGRHVFLLLPGPVPLADAVVGVAALIAAAFRIAAEDVTECGTRHAFRRANGEIAHPGDAGAVELVPHSIEKPPYGWSLALTAAGAFVARGGGIIVDPFEDQPIEHDCVPRCHPDAWSQFIAEARETLSKRSIGRPPQPVRPLNTYTDRSHGPIDRIDPRTAAFIAGTATVGTRNASAFAASANLLGCGVDEAEAQRLILAGAAACGLPERETRAAFMSAVTALRRRARM